MTREEAISELKYAQAMCEFNPSTGEVGFRNDEDRKQHEAFGMAIDALQKDIERHEAVIRASERNLGIVRCKDCRHANECHKSVQYTRNEQNTVTIGYSPIKWCSRGERREP